MGRQKIVTVEKNTGTPRKPFREGEREKHYALLAQQTLGLRRDQKRVKDRKDALDRIVADIEAGGYVTEDQMALPLAADDEADPNQTDLEEHIANGKGKGADHGTSAEA